MAGLRVDTDHIKNKYQDLCQAFESRDVQGYRKAYRRALRKQGDLKSDAEGYCDDDRIWEVNSEIATALESLIHQHPDSAHAFLHEVFDDNNCDHYPEVLGVVSMRSGAAQWENHSYRVPMLDGVMQNAVELLDAEKAAWENPWFEPGWEVYENEAEWGEWDEYGWVSQAYSQWRGVGEEKSEEAASFAEFEAPDFAEFAALAKAVIGQAEAEPDAATSAQDLSDLVSKLHAETFKPETEEQYADSLSSSVRDLVLPFGAKPPLPEERVSSTSGLEGPLAAHELGNKAPTNDQDLLSVLDPAGVRELISPFGAQAILPPQEEDLLDTLKVQDSAPPLADVMPKPTVPLGVNVAEVQLLIRPFGSTAAIAEEFEGPDAEFAAAAAQLLGVDKSDAENEQSQTVDVGSTAAIAEEFEGPDAEFAAAAAQLLGVDKSDAENEQSQTVDDDFAVLARSLLG